MLHLPAVLTALLSRLLVTAMDLVTGSCSPENVTWVSLETDSNVVDAAVMESNTTDRLLDESASRSSKSCWLTDLWTTHVAVELWPGNTDVLDVHAALTVVPVTVLASAKLARLTVPVFRTETAQSMKPAGREDRGSALITLMALVYQPLVRAQLQPVQSHGSATAAQHQRSCCLAYWHYRGHVQPDVLVSRQQ